MRLTASKIRELLLSEEENYYYRGRGYLLTFGKAENGGFYRVYIDSGYIVTYVDDIVVDRYIFQEEDK